MTETTSLRLNRISCVDDDDDSGDKVEGFCSTLTKISVTRMLTINVSITNLTVARLEQFRPPQLRIQKEQPTDVGVA